MRIYRSSHIAVIFLVITLTATSAGAWPHKRAQKARVHFLTASTFIRGTWGQNEDTYLAQLFFPRQTEAVLVRLVDAYPNECPPLARNLLQSKEGVVLSVKRDAECDRPFGEILLRTAPGDPKAILSDRLGYKPLLDRTPVPGTILLCYRVQRR